MKKIGIMSLYYKTYNYGAQLQAYALQKAIENLGFECEQICYKWQNADIENFYQTRLNNIDKFRKFANNIPHSKRIYDPINIYEANNEYDVLVTGSDQVWGVTASMPRYVLPHMCLSFTDEEKVKFSYGASFGSVKITTDRIPVLKYWASKLDALSMREQSAVSQIEDITGKPAVSVLDPTFLLDRSEWESLIKPDSIDEEYIFVYNIGGNRELEKAAAALSEKTGCAVKTIAYSYEEEAGPAEFLGLIKNAKYVLTTSFHGTCFSIIFEKQFFAFPVDKVQSEFSKNIRIKDLLEKIGEKSRFATTAQDIDFDTLIDYKKVNAIMNKEKEKSLYFLKASTALKKNTSKQVKNIKAAERDSNTPIWEDYLQSLGCEESEIINYENKICENFYNYDKLKRQINIEVRRNSLYLRMLKYQMYGCVLEDEPFIKGKVIIYGAGKVGRVLADCSNKNVVACFLESTDRLQKVDGIPVYRIGSDEIKGIMEDSDTTIIVTPVWDFEDVYQGIYNAYPNASVISVEKVVEKLWE
jgi:hypothetical protein